MVSTGALTMQVKTKTNTFNPIYTLTHTITALLLRIEAANTKAQHLPITAHVLDSLRESARLMITHYSTMIEGNRLTSSEIEQVIKHKGHFPGRERDQKEIQGYYSALNFVERCIKTNTPLSAKLIQHIHAHVMGDGTSNHIKPSPYRTGQNVIRDSATHTIIYLPPEAADVPTLMTDLTTWLTNSPHIPCPIQAAIAHYQYATIHPYYDGNGRTARLLTTLILHQGGYGLKGLYSLEEYYARNLQNYYAALTVGPSHNYYLGRAEADITPWLEYFLEGMAIACEAAIKHMTDAQARTSPDHSALLRHLDPRQRKVLSLFKESATVTARDIQAFLHISPVLSTQLCKKWTDQGFLIISNPSNKARSYKLAPQYELLVTT
jgi:Fic family protein